MVERHLNQLKVKTFQVKNTGRCNNLSSLYAFSHWRRLKIHCQAWGFFRAQKLSRVAYMNTFKVSEAYDTKLWNLNFTSCSVCWTMGSPSMTRFLPWCVQLQRLYTIRKHIAVQSKGKIAKIAAITTIWVQLRCKNYLLCLQYDRMLPWPMTRQAEHWAWFCPRHCWWLQFQWGLPEGYQFHESQSGSQLDCLGSSLWLWE